MDSKRQIDSGHGAGAVTTDWVVLVAVATLLTILVMSWVFDELAQAARDTGKSIENSHPTDR